MGTFGSWLFIGSGAMLILLAIAGGESEPRWVRVVQALTGMFGILVGVLALLGEF